MPKFTGFEVQAAERVPRSRDTRLPARRRALISQRNFQK